MSLLRRLGVAGAVVIAVLGAAAPAASAHALLLRTHPGAGRVVGWGFGVVRFLWFASLLGLVGAAVVRLWVWTPAVRHLGLSESDAAEGFRRRFARTFPALWAVLLVAGALSILFET